MLCVFVGLKEWVPCVSQSTKQDIVRLSYNVGPSAPNVCKGNVRRTCGVGGGGLGCI